MCFALLSFSRIYLFFTRFFLPPTIRFFSRIYLSSHFFSTAYNPFSHLSFSRVYFHTFLSTTYYPFSRLSFSRIYLFSHFFLPPNILSQAFLLTHLFIFTLFFQLPTTFLTPFFLIHFFLTLLFLPPTILSHVFLSRAFIYLHTLLSTAY